MILRAFQSEEITTSPRGDSTIIVDPPRSGLGWFLLFVLFACLSAFFFLGPTYLGLPWEVGTSLHMLAVFSPLPALMSLFRCLRVRRVSNRLVLGPSRCVYTRHGPIQTRTHEFERSDFEGFVRRNNGDLFVSTRDGLLPFHRGYVTPCGDTVDKRLALISESSPPTRRRIFENHVFRLHQLGNRLVCTLVKKDAPAFELLARTDGVVLLEDGVVRHKCAWDERPRLIYEAPRLYFAGEDRVLTIQTVTPVCLREAADPSNSFIKAQERLHRSQVSMR